MSNLSNILNPENSRNRSLVTSRPETLGFVGPTHNISQHERNVTGRQSDAHLVHDHLPHPNCPDTLACLPDTDGRPQHTLPVILRCAILGSPRKRLTIREIYAAMEEKYSYYKTAGPTWKQSVRHHLSLNRLFERQPRPVTDPGFGSYWTVNLSAPPGTKRPRKRGRGNKDANAVAAGQTQGLLKNPIPSSSSHSVVPSTVNPIPSEPSLIAQASESQVSGQRRQSNGRGFTPISSHDGEEDDASTRYGDGPPESGDEYDSEESIGAGVSYNRRDSLGLTPYPPPSSSTQIFSLPPIATLDKTSPSDPVVERLQSEIDSLRRQSAEAVSVSLRLSEQLAQAQAEVSRSRAAVRDLEDMLEDETLRRKEAERQLAHEESKRRQMAKDIQPFGGGPSRSPDRSRPM